MSDESITVGEPRPEARGRGLRDRAVARVRAAGWSLPTLLVLLALAAALYLWGLDRSGWANSYYAAAVQAATKSWKAWFFGSFDSSNFITVDKTPGSLWLMGLSARIFGLNSWSLLVPEALCGVATVGLVYVAVKRWWGIAGGLIAGLVVAATPVAALMFRFDNPEPLFTLALVGAAYAVMRAVENGRTWWLIFAGALVGFAFLTKMLEAFVVLPAFAVAYVVFGKPRMLKRAWQVVVSAAAVAISAGWWVVVVQLWPAASRPFIGGSTSNSVLQLAFGYNGLGRLNGNEVGAVGPQGPVTGTWINNQLFGSTGLGRLFRGNMGHEISWLLPAVLIALAAAIVLACVYRKEARTGRMFRAALIVWGGWLLSMGAVFSYMEGIIHPYYNVVLAPPLGVLLGITVSELWRRRANLGWRIFLGLIPAASAGWAFYLLGQEPGWLPSLRWVLLLLGLGATVALLAYDWPGGRLWRRALAATVAGIALVAALGGSGAWALATAGQPHTGAIPSSGPSAVAASMGMANTRVLANGRGAQNGGGRSPVFPGGNGGGQPPAFQGGGPGGGGPGGGFFGLGQGAEASEALVALLQEDASTYRWTAAMTAASTAAPIQLASGTPIMALGGFNGTDQSLTLERFKAYVAAGDIHYYIVGGGYANSPVTGVESEIAAWVRQNFTSLTAGSTKLYDLTSPLASTRG
jgi:4-amino-4-deoxy-L-arabinose transferase-like glycosyltransferase